MGTIISRKPPGCKENVYYYHETYRVKVDPGKKGKKKGSGASKVKSKDIYLGKADEILKSLKEGHKPEEVHSSSFGLECAVLSVLEELSVIEIIDDLFPKRNQGLSVGYYIALGILAKICAPMVSWRSFKRWISTTVIPEKLGVDLSLVDPQNFWDHFEKIMPQTEIKAVNKDQKPQDILDDDLVMDIEKKVWEKIAGLYHIPLDVLLYDTTNFYTYIDSKRDLNLLAKGKNKAGRNQLNQVGLALAVTKEGGLPLLHLLYRGCRHDARLFPESLTRLVNRVTELSKATKTITLVFDKGNNSEKNLKELSHKVEEKTDGKLKMHAIGSLVPSHFSNLIKISLKRFESNGSKKFFSLKKEVFGLPCRVVVTYNEKAAKKQKYALDRDIKKLKQQLRQCFAQKKEKNAAKKEIEEAIAKTLKGKKGCSCLKTMISGRRIKKISIKIDQKEKRKHIQKMGKRILFSTNLSLTPEEIINLYDVEKDKVESTFKLSKSPEITRLQPVRHWIDSKIRVYALICVLSLLTVKLMVYKAKEAGVAMSSEVICIELKDIREVLLLYSEKNVEKMLTTMSTIQNNLFELFELERYAPTVKK